MTEISYSKKLRSPKWQQKRLEILQRDSFQCKYCKDEDSFLNVHHKRYLNGKNPWEYKSEDLITVCEDCHSVIEYLKKIGVDISGSVIFKMKNDNKMTLFFIAKTDGVIIVSVNNNSVDFSRSISNEAFRFLKDFISKI